MKTVKSTTIEKLHRGLQMVHSTKEGEIITLKFSEIDARELGLRLLRMLGTKRGEAGE